MLRALRELEVGGVHTTVPAPTSRCSPTPTSPRGNHSTNWVEEEVDPALAPRRPRPAPARRPDADADGAPSSGADRAGRGRRQALLGQAVAARGAGGATPHRRRAARRRGREAGGGGGGGAGGDGTVSAPMQGTIVKVLVDVGDAVEPGQALLVLEAMKMENHINAESGGTVKEIRVAAGDTVGTGDVLLVIE